MKLPMPGSCLRESGGGNFKTQTALGDALVFWSSDRGSTPLGSIQCAAGELIEFARRVVVIIYID